MVTGLRTGLEAAKKFAVKHSPELLAGASIIAGAAAGYFAFKGGYDTAVDISQMEEPTKKEMAKVVVKNSWPALVAEAANVAVNVVAAKNGIKTQKSLASVANAYAMQAEAFDIYRRHTREYLGEKKEGEMRGDIAEEEMRKNWPGDEGLIENTGHGNKIFMDGLTKKFFMSDLDYIRRQQVRLNEWFLSGEDEVSFTEWCAALDVECADDLAIYVWTPDQKIDFEIDTCLAPNGEPAYYLNYQAKCLSGEMRLSDRISKVY